MNPETTRPTAKPITFYFPDATATIKTEDGQTRTLPIGAFLVEAQEELNDLFDGVDHLLSIEATQDWPFTHEKTVGDLVDSVWVLSYMCGEVGDDVYAFVEWVKNNTDNFIRFDNFTEHFYGAFASIEAFVEEYLLSTGFVSPTNGEWLLPYINRKQVFEDMLSNDYYALENPNRDDVYIYLLP